MLMAVMMSPREKWTDERLDDLSLKVDRGFADVKAEMKGGFERMESRFGERFDAVDRRFEEIDERLKKFDERFGKMDDRFHALRHTLLGAAAVIIATLIAGILF